MNYIKEHTLFIEYASDNCLTANERLLWYALMHIFNKKAMGSVWPETFVSVSNKRLLSLVPFGQDSLVKARSRLIQREPCIFEYVQGRKNATAPKYKLHYLSNKVYPEFACKTYNNMGGKTDNNMGGNIGGKTDYIHNRLDVNDRLDVDDINKKNTTTAVNGAQKCKYAYNTAWKYDGRARRAVANNILNDLEDYKADGFDGVVSLISDLLGQGMEPDSIHDALIDCRSGNYAVEHLRSYIDYHGLEFEI